MAAQLSLVLNDVELLATMKGGKIETLLYAKKFYLKETFKDIMFQSIVKGFIPDFFAELAV